MVETSMTTGLVAEFTENYLGKIFYFCLKKTGNANSAEDLTQEIALHVLTALNKGIIPEHFSAWIWKIARNQYAVWANEKHKKAESIAAADIGDYEISDENANILDNMIHKEQISLCRRELAFIGSDYRNILRSYYIEHQRVRNIAMNFSLSVSAVKQRLFRARNILKEGMKMAREFGVRSYNPEEIVFCNNCERPGKKNQPYSVIEHILYQNIFLEAYGNPSTAEELSVELGVALPYMENELRYLTHETFLIEKEGKYQTSFPIISCAVQEQAHIAQLSAAQKISKVLTDFIDRLHAAFKLVGYSYYGDYQDYDSAKWTLLMLAYDYFLCKSSRMHNRTERPDNGIWDIIGYQKCNVVEPDFVGQHGSDCGFQQFKYEFDGIADRTPPYLTDEESKTLCDLALGNAKRMVPETVKALERYGYLHRSGDTCVPDILVFRMSEIKRMTERFSQAAINELSEMAENARTLFRSLYEKIAEAVNSDLPEIFSKDDNQCMLVISSLYFARGYVMAQARLSGWLLPVCKVSPAIGAYLVVE